MIANEARPMRAAPNPKTTQPSTPQSDSHDCVKPCPRLTLWRKNQPRIHQQAPHMVLPDSGAYLAAQREPTAARFWPQNHSAWWGKLEAQTRAPWFRKRTKIWGRKTDQKLVSENGPKFGVGKRAKNWCRKTDRVPSIPIAC